MWRFKRWVIDWDNRPAGYGLIYWDDDTVVQISDEWQNDIEGIAPRL